MKKHIFLMVICLMLITLSSCGKVTVPSKQYVVENRTVPVDVVDKLSQQMLHEAWGEPDMVMTNDEIWTYEVDGKTTYIDVKYEHSQNDMIVGINLAYEMYMIVAEIRNDVVLAVVNKEGFYIEFSDLARLSRVDAAGKRIKMEVGNKFIMYYNGVTYGYYYPIQLDTIIHFEKQGHINAEEMEMLQEGMNIYHEEN